MPSLVKLLALLIKYGPTVVRIVREIEALLEAIRGDKKVGTVQCGAYRRRYENERAFLDSALPHQRAWARARVTSLRDDLRGERSRR